jgi:hypothetical protein
MRELRPFARASGARGVVTEDHVNDAVRIAATFHGVAVALEM